MNKNGPAMPGGGVSVSVGLKLPVRMLLPLVWRRALAYPWTVSVVSSTVRQRVPMPAPMAVSK